MISDTDSVLSVLDLRDRLKESGVPVDGMDDEIQKASVHIAKDLGILVSREPGVKINNESFLVAEAIQRDLDRRPEPLRIEKNDGDSDS